jgi:hypothetical protein
MASLKTKFKAPKQVRHVSGMDKSGKSNELVDRGEKGDAVGVWRESTKAHVLGPAYFNANKRDKNKDGGKGSGKGSGEGGGGYSYEPVEVDESEFFANGEGDGGGSFQSKVFKRPGGEMGQTSASSSDALNKRFDLIKQKLMGETQAAQQQQAEGMQRELARRGSLNSGEGLKLQQQMADQNVKQLSDVASGVEAERAGAQFEEEQMEKQRQFAREERLGSQEFASGERASGEQFARAERLSQQGFSKDLFNSEMAFKAKGMEIQQGQFAEQMKHAFQQLELDTEVSRFNMEMAEKMWNKKDMMEAFANMWGYDPRTGGTSKTGMGKIFGDKYAPW